MVPIHESDLAENRWKSGEWSTIELWEKVEQQFRRRRRWTFTGVVVLFLALSAIPIVKDRSPKWRTLALARKLTERVNHHKLLAVKEKRAVSLSLEEKEGSLILLQSWVASCESPPTAPQSDEVLAGPDRREGISILRQADASVLGLERIVTSACFDPNQVLAAEEGRTSSSEQALAFIPANDLTEKRTDRISFVFIRPGTTQISFD